MNRAELAVARGHQESSRKSLENGDQNLNTPSEVQEHGSRVLDDVDQYSLDAVLGLLETQQ